MTELKHYYGKKVTVVDVDGETFIGLVDEYIFPEDNENGEESIVIKTNGGDLVEFTSHSIKEITII